MAKAKPESAEVIIKTPERMNIVDAFAEQGTTIETDSEVESRYLKLTDESHNLATEVLRKSARNHQSLRTVQFYIAMKYGIIEVTDMAVFRDCYNPALDLQGHLAPKGMKKRDPED